MATAGGRHRGLGRMRRPDGVVEAAPSATGVRCGWYGGACVWRGGREGAAGSPGASQGARGPRRHEVTVVRSLAEARQWVRSRQAAGQRVGLVPTMGALHDGHLALVGGCRGAGQADAVVLTVFVNPTQFAAGEDLERYPRDLDADCLRARRAGVDLLCVPRDTDLYPLEPRVFVDVGRLGAVLEGVHRPTHFRGVATVVTKLLVVLTPDVVAFGQKDAQQVVVVRRVVRELLLTARVLCVPTVREADGLALSSRNVYLTPAERVQAPVLSASLEVASAAVRAGERSTAAVEAILGRELARADLGRVDYAAAVTLPDLQPLPTLAGDALLAVAVRFSAVRLLDNACLRVTGDVVTAVLP